MRMDLDTGKPNRYETQEEAQARAARLLQATGIWTGVRTRKDGTISLVYDPWSREVGPQISDGEEQDDFADSDVQLQRLPPGDGDAGADLPVGAAVGETAQ